MSQKLVNSFEPDDEPLELEDEAELEPASDKLYVAIGKPELVKRFSLAFTVPDDLPPILVQGFTLAWSKQALATLASMQKGSRNTDKNLPYASLRGLLEVGINNLERIETNLGLGKSILNYKGEREPEPFAYLLDGEDAEIRKVLRPILNDWFSGFLRPFAKREKMSPEMLERLEDLREQGELLKITPLKSQVLPWLWSPETGTTDPNLKRDRYVYAYRILADYTARLIAGRQVFQGLGPMRRIVSSSGIFTSGVAELITSPIPSPNSTDRGTFSLVIRLEVITLPSLHQPLLKIDVSKRRWLEDLKPAGIDRNSISGYMFSKEHPSLAFSYRLLRQQDEHKIWKWETDKDFEVLRRKLNLSLESFDGQQIASDKASREACDVVLTYRNGLQEQEHSIKAGVPELDKLEAFEAIAELLKPFGIQPFEQYSPVKINHVVDDSASRTINAPTLLGAALEFLETGEREKFTPKYLGKMDDDKLDRLLRKHFSFGLGDIQGNRRRLEFSNSKSLDQTDELKELIQANQEAMRRIYPNQQLSLVIFYEDELQLDKKLLEAIVQVLWGGTVELSINRLPANTHGSRETLPGKELKAKERSQKRVEAWRSIVEQLEAKRQRTFCLVMARMFYPAVNGNGTVKLDDRVNKPSTRQALAAMAGSCVQFILPIKRSQKSHSLDLQNFLHRVQSALKDLLSAHSGRIDNVQQKVDKYLKDIPFEARPKEILGITVVRKQKGRVRGFIEDTFLPIAIRLQVETGACEMCCAYEKGNSLTITSWSSFPDAITSISQISPVKLADKQDVRKTRFMEFVKQIISNSVEEGTQPLIIIDSSNCVQLWPWLADVRINAAQIKFEQLYEWMEQEWEGARLIRIRQELAPAPVEKKVRRLAETSLEDERLKKELVPTCELPSASDSRGLFRLTATAPTGCITYLSVGRKMLHQYLRGQSCYRSTQINTSVKKTDGSRDRICNKAKLKVDRIATQPPFLGQWPTPNPLEIVVTLRQPKDDPDALAALVESLRYSFGHYRDWTTLPAPLFFERVVRDYMSEFSIGDEEDEVELDIEESTN